MNRNTGSRKLGMIALAMLALSQSDATITKPKVTEGAFSHAPTVSGNVEAGQHYRTQSQRKKKTNRLKFTKKAKLKRRRK